MINRLKETNGCDSTVDAVVMASVVDPMDLEITQVMIKPLAYEMLESNLGKEASLDILKAFLGSTAQLVLELQVALCKQNTREATIVLREIESSCTVVGANGVLDQCFMMEEHLQKSDWKALDGCMLKLAQETGLVSQFINQLLSQAIRKHFRR